MTTSTPPAWHWLSECEEPLLSTAPRILPDPATLGVQNDSNQCANGEQCPPSALIPSDQCDECRSAPGQPHATGCECTAPLTDSVSNVAPSHRIGTCYLDPDTGETVMPADFFGEKELRWMPDKIGPECDVSSGPVISCDRKDDNLDDEPSLVKVESCPECGTVTDIEYEDAGPDTLQVPFPVQEWMFESLCGVEIEKLHDLIDDHHDLILEMARDRFRKGYAKYGSAAYQWDAETRLTNVLEELADSVVYLTTGAVE